MARKKNPAAVSLGRKGGKKRAENLTAEQLSEQGRKAVEARWAKAKAAAVLTQSEPKKANKGAGRGP